MKSNKQISKSLLSIAEVSVSESYELGKPNKKLILTIDYSFEKRLSVKTNKESNDGKDIPGLLLKIQETLDGFLEI